MKRARCLTMSAPMILAYQEGRKRQTRRVVMPQPEEITPNRWDMIRHGGAVAVTIPEPIRGFQGWRRRWWDREDEVPFPDWRKSKVEEEKSGNRVPEPGEAHADLGGQVAPEKPKPEFLACKELLEQKFDLVEKLEPKIEEYSDKVKAAKKVLKDAEEELKKYRAAKKDALESMPLIRKGRYIPPVETAEIEFED